MPQKKTEGLISVFYDFINVSLHHMHQLQPP